MSDDSAKKLPNGHILRRKSDGGFSLECHAPSLYIGPPADQMPPDGPLELWHTPLPQDMVCAIRTLTKAKHGERDLPHVERAIETMMEYVNDARTHRDREKKDRHLTLSAQHWTAINLVWPICG